MNPGFVLMNDWYAPSVNPFYVLDVPVDCHPTEIERAGQKWLAMLTLDLEEAKHYRSPLGEHVRTDVEVRQAMATLRVPEKRLFCELWYVPVDLSLLQTSSVSPSPSAKPQENAPDPCLLWQCAGFPGLKP